MKIPIDIDNKNEFRDNSFSIGDKVRILTEINLPYVRYTVGHEFTIIGDDDYGFIMQDEDGDIVNRISSWCKMTKIITYKEAKLKSQKADELKYIKDLVYKKCEHKIEEYDNRDVYYVCAKKEQGRGYRSYGHCDACLDCLKHQTDEVLKDEKLKLYLRSYKLEKLMK